MTMRKISLICQILSLTLLLSACSTVSNAVAPTLQVASASALEESSIIQSLSAEVVLTYVDLEGGFYQFSIDDNDYVFMNARDFELESLTDKPVYIEGLEMDWATIFMSGYPVFVTLIQTLDQ